MFMFRGLAFKNKTLCSLIARGPDHYGLTMVVLCYEMMREFLNIIRAHTAGQGTIATVSYVAAPLIPLRRY